MAGRTALGYVLDNDGKLVDAFIQAPTATDPQPTAVEREIVRIVKEHRDLRTELALQKERCKDNEKNILARYCYENNVAIVTKEFLTQFQNDITKLKAFIQKNNPIHRHDHDYFHDDCTLCGLEKLNYEELKQLLKKQAFKESDNV